MTMPTQAYVYYARVRRVIDGDTLDLEVSLGLHDYRVERVRLLHVDTPETRGVPDRAPGLAALSFTAAWLKGPPWPTSDFPLVVQTVKTDSFGRFLADVWRETDGANLSDDLLAAGHAVAYEGGQR